MFKSSSTREWIEETGYRIKDYARQFTTQLVLLTAEELIALLAKSGITKEGVSKALGGYIVFITNNKQNRGRKHNFTYVSSSSALTGLFSRRQKHENIAGETEPSRPSRIDTELRKAKVNGKEYYLDPYLDIPP
ncbi:hypothetical protein IMZ48_42610 [Candidatus Bathyarchaeota archaeon]|nr:hypothetical protein [Candidatus Bathyarchaeota archaeon]